MGDFIADGEPWEAPEGAAAQDYANLPVSTGGAFSSLLGENLAPRLGRQLQLHQAASEADPAAQQEANILGGLAPDANLSAPPAPKMDPEEANKQFAPAGEKLFTEPVAEGVARVMGKQKADQIQRESILSRWAANTSLPIRLGASFAAGLLDPLNDAAAFVPAIGEETLLARLGTGAIARTAARAGAGAVSGAAAMAPLAGLEYGLSQAERSDYSLRDALYEMAMGAAIGAIGHAGFGAVGDWWRRGRSAEAPAPSAEIAVEAQDEAHAVAAAPASVKADAMRSAVAQMVDGRPIDVGPVVEGARAEVTAAPEAEPLRPASLAQQQADLYRNGFAPGMAQPEFDALNEAIYGEKAEPAGAEASGQGEQEKPATAAPERQRTAPSGEAKPTRAQSAEAQPAGQPRPVLVAQPQTLIGFLKAMGGLRDDPQLEGRDLRRSFPGLMNNRRGVSLDRAREAAAEAGYFGFPIDRAMSESTISDLLGKLESHPQYSERDAERLAAWKEQAAAKQERDVAKRGLAAVHEFASANGLDVGDTELMVEAARILAEGHETEIDNALERAAIELYNRDVSNAAAHGERSLINGAETTGLDQETQRVVGEVGERGAGPGSEGSAGGARQEVRGAQQLSGQDAELAIAEQRLSESGIALTAAERAELDATAHDLQAATQRAEGFAQAGECLAEAGI